MGLLSPEKLVLVALVVALVFGSKSLPGIAQRAGKGIRETREAIGIEAIRDGIGEVRSTVTESTSSTAADATTAGVENDGGTKPPVERSSERPG